MSPHLLVFGAGSLAGEIVRSLVPHGLANAGLPMKITIASRNLARARWIAAVAGAQAAALGCSVEIVARPHDWGSVKATAALVDAAAADLVLNTASYQSAAMLDCDNRWSRFVRACGYGVTAPLQLALARHLQEALAASRRRPRWINACYPDLVNGCLALDGPAPICGIGNVAILAEHLRQQLSLQRDAPLRIVAAHLHVVQFQRGRMPGDPLPAAWLGPDRIEPAKLAALEPLPDGASLNAFNASQAAALLWCLLVRRPMRTHAPAPQGLPGGYPVLLTEEGASLDLPEGLDRDEAIAMNAAAVAAEGAALDGDFIKFSPEAREILRRASPLLAEGFPVREAAEAARLLLDLRADWRAQP